MESVRRFRVYGRVQGVGFRAFVWRAAATLGISGWTRNRFDGTVEALVRGPAETLDLFGQQLRQGPRLSRVDRVEIVDEPPELDVGAGFSVRPDA